jgi:hypothetical protein
MSAISATGVAIRRFPMKQANYMKMMQEKRAASKRKLEEMVSGMSHDHPNWERKPDDLPLCPICLEVYKEAHVTKCGHTYCHECICLAIDFKPNCPNCNSVITKEDLVPNLVIAQVVASQKAKIAKTEPADGEKPDDVLKGEFHLSLEESFVCNFFILVCLHSQIWMYANLLQPDPTV